MAVPSLRVFCLESTQTLDEDPEGLLQVRNEISERSYVQKYFRLFVVTVPFCAPNDRCIYTFYPPH